MSALVLFASGIGSAGLATAAGGATPDRTAASGAPARGTDKPLVSLVTGAPDGPFSSGQYIEVKVGPNSIFRPGSRIHIEECDPPTGEESWRRTCDHRTVQTDPLRANSDGSVDYLSYPIYALPDAAVLGEHPWHRPRCDLTHACVLFVGQDFEDGGQHALSAQFYVNPTPGDTGANPGNGLPEAPFVLALPVLALGAFGGSVLARRHRSTVLRNR